MEQKTDITISEYQGRQRPYSVRLMRGEDVPQIAEIDREAFPSQWPPPFHIYERELKNRLASYIVATENGSTWENPNSALMGPFDSLVRLFRRQSARRRTPLVTDYIVGFAGFWRMVDEAHLTTIGVRKSHRQRGVGELMLISIVDMAMRGGSNMVTLEVRASNYEAQSLYRKYGFTEVGLRKNYYAEDGEDALIMTSDPITSSGFQQRFQEIKKQRFRRMNLIT